jgi:hypothetical protein
MNFQINYTAVTKILHFISNHSDWSLFFFFFFSVVLSRQTSLQQTQAEEKGILFQSQYPLQEHKWWKIRIQKLANIQGSRWRNPSCVFFLSDSFVPTNWIVFFQQISDLQFFLVLKYPHGMTADQTTNSHQLLKILTKWSQVTIYSNPGGWATMFIFVLSSTATRHFFCCFCW